jgi:uncharacterized protein YfaS (alpha-2-macroglobulin family)
MCDKKRCWAVVATAAALVTTSCGPKVRPGLVVAGDPIGEARSAPGFAVTASFDRPMVAPELVGQVAANPPCVLRPRVEGDFRWTSDRTLAFFPKAPLPRSTHYEVEIPKGTRAPDGFGLESAFRWSFDYERITAELSFPATALPDPTRWATPDVSAKLELNQPALAKTVRRACSFRAGDKKIDVALVKEQDDDTPRKSFSLGPQAPLALDTAWTLRCDESLVGVEGPLPLEKPAELSFRTYGPMKVVGVTPRGYDANIDDVEIAVEFSNPPARKGRLPVRIEPKIDGFPGNMALDGARLSLNAHSLEATTEYAIHVDGALTDVFGQKLPGSFDATFTTGSASPRLDVETGSWTVEASRGNYPIWTRNLTKLEVQAAAVPVAKLPALLGALDFWDEQSVDLAKLKIPSVKKKIALKTKANRWEQWQLDPRRVLGPQSSATGLYYFSVQAPEAEGGDRSRELLVNFTDLGLTTKLSAESGLVWATHLSDGKPAEDVEITILNRKGETKWRGMTGADGIAVTPGTATLLPETKKDHAAARDGEEDIEEEHWGWRAASRLIVLARSANDMTFVDPLASGGLSAWNFHVQSDSSPGAERVRGFIHSDRGLYRPGDTVHLRGLVRVLRAGEGLRVPSESSAEVRVLDPRGQEVARQTKKLSRYGGFDLDVPIAEDGKLGDYSVHASIAGGEVSERFSVEEYRPATIEVKAHAAKPSYVVGQHFKVEAEARYLYGSPLRDGKVKWSAHARRRYVSFESLPGYHFEDERNWRHYWDRSSEGESFYSEEERTLDANGKASFAFPLGSKDFTEPVDLLVSATAEDETHQAISANVAVPLHVANAYIGIASDSYFVQAGKPEPIHVVAVDVDGKRIALSAKAVIQQVSYNCAWEAWGYRGSYRCQEKQSDVVTQNLEIGAGAPAEIPFTAPTGGTYLVVVEAKDAEGRKIVAAEHVYASGGGEPAWLAEDQDHFDILPDKPKYKPGETAHLLLQTSVPETRALVTLERGGVLEHRLVPLAKGAQTIDVDVGDSYAPNVYASVMLVAGRMGAGARGLPSMKMGLVNLPVETVGKDLKVEVTTDRESYRPGEQVTAAISVTDGTGRPTQSEVSVAAADEGVLTLIGFKTPDPLASFYAPWGLGVQTATEYERLAKLPEPGEERSATGGDGSGEGPSGRLGTPRSRFRATAFWNPRLETDAQGKAVVTFQAPDNLTAFRVMAVAADTTDRFGSGDHRFTVRKPLQLLSAVPRFLDVGDEVEAGVLVVNETGAAGKVTVDADVDGVEIVGKKRLVANVPAGGRAPVYVKAKAVRGGEATFRFSASLGEERDAVVFKIPVKYPAPPETLVLGEGDASSRVELPITLPEGIVPGTASIEVSIDPDGLAGLEEGLRDLVEYPYGCLEQTTSRLIPLVMVEELAKSLALKDLDGPNLQHFIRAGVAKIGRHQTEEGGFSLWVGGEAEPYLTAFGLFGLKTARDAGHPVEEQEINAAIAYLHRSLSEPPRSGGVHNELGDRGASAFALYMLDRLGKPEPGFATKLLESRDSLPRFGQAFLARALAGSLGPRDPAVSSLLDGLTGAARHDGDAAFVDEPTELRWYMSDDVRTTAIVADTLVALRPDDPLLPKLVHGLMKARRSSGRFSWGVTQDNLYALVALTDYAKGQSRAASAADVSIGDKIVLAADFAATDGARDKSDRVRVRHKSIPLGETTVAAPIVVTPKKGSVHYAVTLRFQRDVEHQREAREGFTVRREYLDPTTERPMSSMKTGDIVRVRVTFESTEARTYVAVSDALPAGFEPLQSTFATTAAATPSSKDPSWWMSYQEMHDDRVDAFADWLWKGSRTFSYLVRATHAGRFVVPAATVEAMYDPTKHARLAPQWLDVRAQ